LKNFKSPNPLVLHFFLEDIEMLRYRMLHQRRSAKEKSAEPPETVKSATGLQRFGDFLYNKAVDLKLIANMETPFRKKSKLVCATLSLENPFVTFSVAAVNSRLRVSKRLRLFCRYTGTLQ